MRHYTREDLNEDPAEHACDCHDFRHGRCVRCGMWESAFSRPFTCPVCGEEITHGELMRGEGACLSCHEQQTADLMRHNFEVDRWNRMSERERDAEIRHAMRIS